MNISLKATGNRQNDRLTEFSKLYGDYYVLLCTIAKKYLGDNFLAEDAVGYVFWNYWEKYDEIEITTSIKAYLVRSVKNRCLNIIKHHKIEQKAWQKIINENIYPCLSDTSDYPLGTLYEKELEEKITETINSLPQQCKKIFLLSRIEELPHKEISEQLGVSVNTVKTHLKVALLKLKENLKDYLITFFALVTLIK